MLRLLGIALLAGVTFLPTAASASFGGGGGPYPPAFWCRAVAGQSSQADPAGESNDCAAPASSTRDLRTLSLSHGLRVTQGTATTSITPEPAGGGTASVELAGVRITGPGLDLRIDGARASARVRCVDGAPVSSSSGGVTSVSVNGRHYADITGRTVLRLPRRAVLVLNEDASIGWDTTYVEGRTAVSIQSGAGRLDLGSAYAGRNANPCTG